jgi:S1-C subfamily serine protease
MRDRVSVWTAFYLLVYVLQTFAQANWELIVPGLDKRVVRLEMVYKNDTRSTCTGVVLNKASGFVATAQHCVDGDLLDVTVNRRYAQVVRQSKLLDIAVLRTELVGVDNMALVAETPKAGAPVAVLGYAWARKQLHWQFGNVSLPIDEDGLLIVDGVTIPGDSGGAAFNQKGEFVGLVSGFYYGPPAAHLSIMVPAEKMREFAEMYLPIGVK